MDVEQYLEEAVAQDHISREDKNSLEKWRGSSDAVSDSEASSLESFDCNICLDTVQDPVITLCGHLYCWPCIYKWLHFQTISIENQDQKEQQCPVCKAEVSHTTLIPLYGRGVSTKASRGNTPQFGLVIPKRPLGPTCRVATPRSLNSTNSPQFAEQLHHRGYSHNYPQQGSYPASPVLNPAGMTINVLDPVTRIFGEMVYARVFGNSITNLYTYPNSYNLSWSTSPRIRRHVMQADKSLSRISFFLFCCIFLCLLLF